MEIQKGKRARPTAKETKKPHTGASHRFSLERDRNPRYVEKDAELRRSLALLPLLDSRRRPSYPRATYCDLDVTEYSQ